ncbi:hypothetical protein MTBUT4_620002 [Magnetospirillum sp. UT-4]|nr:hypothetical protein MTBUT4_620002 [Magnetospirillum sp. UT-4]
MRVQPRLDDIPSHAYQRNEPDGVLRLTLGNGVRLHGRVYCGCVEARHLFQPHARQQGHPYNVTKGRPRWYLSE